MKCVFVDKRQRKPKGQSKMDNSEKLANKRQRKPKGQSKMDNSEKLATLGRKQTKQNTQHRELKKMNKTDLTKKPDVNPGARDG